MRCHNPQTCRGMSRSAVDKTSYPGDPGGQYKSDTYVQVGRSCTIFSNGLTELCLLVEIIFFAIRKKPQTDYNNPSPARRSRQAKARVAKMRKMFGLNSPKQVSTGSLIVSDCRLLSSLRLATADVFLAVACL